MEPRREVIPRASGAASAAEGEVAGPAPSARQRFLALDSMRGISACIVVLLHVFGAGWVTGSTFIGRGSLFVDFFFVLSGFVIAASYGDRIAQGFSVRRFVLLRLGRLYPLHLAMLMVFLALVALREAGVFPADAALWSFGSHEPGQFVRALLMVESFLPEPTGWNAPSWSIEAEFWTYIIAAFAFAVMKARATAFFAIVVVVAGALSAAYYLGLRWMPLGLNPFNILRCLFAFSLGVLMWEAHRRATAGLVLPRGLAGALEAGLIIVVIAVISLAPLVWVRSGMPLVFAALVLVLAREKGAISRLLMRPWPVILGTLSYSIYMTHAAVLSLVAMVAARLGLFDPTLGYVPGTRGTVPDGVVADLVGFGLLGLVILVSWFTFRWIERPAREWSRRVAARQGAGGAEAIAPTF